MNKSEAAEALGVSVDFFDAHIAHELPVVRRGRRRLYILRDLEHWLATSAERAPYSVVPVGLIVGLLATGAGPL